MKIRKATTADVARLVALNREIQEIHAIAFPERFRRDTPTVVIADAFRSMIAAPSSYWLVAEEEQPVGFLSAEFRQREESWCTVPHRACYISSIVVAPEFRRRGVARELLGELKREAKVRSVVSIELDVWMFNREAKEAFAKLGFEQLMERMTLPKKEPNQTPEPTPATGRGSS